MRTRSNPDSIRIEVLVRTHLKYPPNAILTRSNPDSIRIEVLVRTHLKYPPNAIFRNAIKTRKLNWLNELAQQCRTRIQSPNAVTFSSNYYMYQLGSPLKIELRLNKKNRISNSQCWQDVYTMALYTAPDLKMNLQHIYTVIARP